MDDAGLKEPLKRFDETFSGESVVLDTLRAERPDLDWFVAPEADRIYSINDNPNSCRVIAGRVALCILGLLAGFVLVSVLLTGGH